MITTFGPRLWATTLETAASSRESQNLIMDSRVYYISNQDWKGNQILLVSANDAVPGVRDISIARKRSPTAFTGGGEKTCAEIVVAESATHVPDVHLAAGAVLPQEVRRAVAVEIAGNHSVTRQQPENADSVCGADVHLAVRNRGHDEFVAGTEMVAAVRSGVAIVELV